MPAWPSLAFCGGLGVVGCGLGAVGLGGPPIRPVQRYVQAVLADQPVSLYLLDDLNAALAFDQRGANSGTGSASGITYRAPGPLAEGGYAMTFDGVNGMISSPTSPTWDPSANKPFTVEAIIKPVTLTGATQRILAREPAANHGVILFINLNNKWSVLRGDVAAGIDQSAHNTVLPVAGQYQHVLGVYDGTSLSVWAQAVQGTLLSSPRLCDVGTAAITIGKSASGGSSGSSIACSAFYNYALVPDQITNHFRLFQRAFLFPDMPELAAPYIAHLYTNGMQFKKTLGSASGVRSLVGKPGLKMTINGGYHPVTLDVAAPQPPASVVTDGGFEASDTLADVQVNYALSTPGEWALVTAPTDLRSGRRAMKCTRTNLGPNNWNTIRTQTAKRFAVIPGATYLFSAWYRTNAGVVQSHGKINWKDAAGVAISSSFLATATGATPWTRRTLSVVAPSNAALAEVELLAGWWDGVSGTDAQTWFDDGRLVLGSHTDDPVVLGDIIQLTEQGDPSATVLYTGIVERIAGVSLSLTPLVAELGRTDFNKSYTALTDVGQMVRDAVNLTTHLRVQPETCGDAGVLALYNFNTTNVLEVLQQAKRIAGPSFFYFIDSTGLVWFQPAPTSGPPRITLKRSYDYSVDPLTQPEESIDTLINLIRALGGWPDGASAPVQSTYSNAASQLKYGKRALTPLVYPTVKDQATLDKIVATIGSALDRERTTTEINLPNYGQRLTLGLPGGLVARLFDTAADPYPQPMAGGSGAYLGPYVAQDIEVDGVSQKLVLADVAVASLDELQPILDRIIQGVGVNAVAQPSFVMLT